MDFVLDTCDNLFLDALYSRLIPVSAFLSNVASNSSSHLPIVSTASQSTWSHLVSYLPHPPLTEQLISISNSSPLSISQKIVSAWPREYIPRQLLSLTVLTYLGVLFLYFGFCGFSYYFVFNHEMMQHPRFLKNQVRQEIVCSMQSTPLMIFLTLPWFEGEVLGYSKLYANVDDYGWGYLLFSIPLFLLFTDYGIYWIHRWEHHPAIYKHIHKPHHKWIIPTPWAAYAFHPLDGYAQSLPYHCFVYLVPMHRFVFLSLFIIINFWTILIHDSDMITGHWLENIINGPAHHTLHHLYFTVNYGQYFTWADKAGGSYRHPDSSLDPLLEIRAMQMAKEAETPGKSL